ncbi:MAG: very short patch repair endonuclease [Novosphingobium sp.]|nr:very short patch repair endonuclease [Novosphingobium sp.]
MEEKQKKKISESLKGHIVSAETRNKISLKMTGRKLSKSHKEKVVERIRERSSLKGYRDKLSKSMKGITPKNIDYLMKTGEKTRFEKGQSPWNKGLKNHLSKESRKKISLAGMGRKQSEETKIKRGIYIGRPISEEHKKTLSKLMKERRKGIIVPKFDTSIEVKIQNLLKQLGIEFITHQYMKDIKYSYQCDIFIPVQKGISQKTIIECDGDYWHGNPERIDLIKAKQSIKIQRCLDFERTAQLEEAGFRVIRLWGSEIKPMEINDLRRRL